MHAMTMAGRATQLDAAKTIRRAMDRFRARRRRLQESVATVLMRAPEWPAEELEQPTPGDRWFTPIGGWPLQPLALPDVPAGHSAKPWAPPPLICLTGAEAPQHFDHVADAIGEVCVEVLQAENLPRVRTQELKGRAARCAGPSWHSRARRLLTLLALTRPLFEPFVLTQLMQFDVIDPYAVVIFEGFAARTSAVRNECAAQPAKKRDMPWATARSAASWGCG